MRTVGDVFEMSDDGMVVLTDAATYTSGSVQASHQVAVRPGTDVTAYVESERGAEAARRHRAARSVGPGRRHDHPDHSLTAMLALMLVAVAATGVLHAVVLDTRERIRDPGVHKAPGMTPGRTTAMVSLGRRERGGRWCGRRARRVALHEAVLPATGESAGIGMPMSALTVHDPLSLLLLGVGG